MLVLSRQAGQSIEIDDNITVMVVEIRGDKVRLGIKAPREVPVHRTEIAQRIKTEGRNCPDCHKPLLLCRCGGGECSAQGEAVRHA